MITLNHFILALAIVESSLNPLAIGDNGNAVGYLQITPAVIKDVNYFYDREYIITIVKVINIFNYCWGYL